MRTDTKKGVGILLTVLSVAAALLIVVSLIIQFAVIPKNTVSISRDYTIVTRDVEGAPGHPDVPEVVEENGEEYIRDDAAAEPVVETIETRPIFEFTQEFEALPEERAPLKHEVTVDGETYVLDLAEAEYEPVTLQRETLRETVVFEGQNSKPAPDRTLPITYVSSTGQELTVEGELESLEKTREAWTTYTVKSGRVRLPANASGFVYNGKAIGYNADSPKWDGWKEDVTAVERLNPDSVQLSDIVWVGKAYNMNGATYRDLKITGKRLLQDWTATYVSAGENTTAFNATALYRSYTDEAGIPEEHATDTEYALNVTVRYSLVSLAGSGAFTKTMTANRNVIPFVTIAGCVVLLVCLILLLMVRRMRYRNTREFESGFDEYYAPSERVDRSARYNPKPPRSIVIDETNSFINEVHGEGVHPPSDPFGEEET